MWCCIVVPDVPKIFPNVSCYFSKSAYLIKIIKEIYYTMPNLDLTGFAPIDFPFIVTFLKNGILEMLKKKLKMLDQ